MGSVTRDGRFNEHVVAGAYYADYYGSWNSFGAGEQIEMSVQILQNGTVVYEAAGPQGEVGVTIDSNGSWFNSIGLTLDTVYSWRTKAKSGSVIKVSNMEWYLTWALPVEYVSITASNPTQTTVDVNAQWKANTSSGTATAYLYYKKTTDLAWINFSNSGPQSGSGTQNYVATVTGLDPGTSYQFKLTVVRNTTNATTSDSPIVSQSTLASTPVVTTEDASSVSHIAAVLNGTIDANSLPGGVDVSFQWNSQAYRRIDYTNSNITNAKVVTIGSITYTFLEDTTATGRFNYSGQPTGGDTALINSDVYRFKTPAFSTGGKIAYLDGTNPALDSTVTIPSDTVPAIYRFVEETTASGGRFQYINGTNPANNKTFTIPASVGPDGVYTIVSTVAVPGDVKRGGNADATMLNLERAINQSGGTEGAGADYIAFDFGSGPAPHPLVSAVQDAGLDRINLSVLFPGPGGNIALASTDPSITPTSPSGGAWVENPGDVLIGVNADATMLNLSNAINNSGGTSGAGEDYVAFDFGAGPADHAVFSATHNAVPNDVSLATLLQGAVGNVTLSTTEPSFTLTNPTGGAKVETAGDVLIGASADDTFLNFSRAINNSGGSPGIGGDYLPEGGTASAWVSAVHDSVGDKVDLTAVTSGTAGNAIVLSETSTAITFTAMGGGTDLPGGGYQALIGATSDITMLNLRRAINKDGGTEGIDYVAAAPHPDVVADLTALDNFLSLVVPSNTDPSLTFTTDEPTFTLSTETSSPWANETTPANYSNDGITPFNAPISGLASERTYFFRAKAVYTANGGGTLYGVEKQLTTAGEPGPQALEEEHMQTIQFDGQYGVEGAVTFTLRTPASSSSDLFYSGASPLSTDCFIFKDGVAAGTAANAVTSPGTYLYSLVLTAAEKECETLDVVIHDVSGGAFRDAHLQIRTAMRLSELDIDASEGPTNATAITAIGNGDGHGINASSTGDGQDINAVISSMWLRVGFAQTQGSPSGTKIKLDPNASTTNDYYNGCIVATLGGDGAGQARVIVNYDGGQREATVDTAWSTIPNNTTTYAIGAGARPWQLSPEAELASVPGPTGSYGEMLQLCFQRFAFKIDQTASAQTWYDSSGTPIFDRSVSDDGVTQTIEALANV